MEEMSQRYSQVYYRIHSGALGWVIHCNKCTIVCLSSWESGGAVVKSLAVSMMYTESCYGGNELFGAMLSSVAKILKLILWE